MAPTYLRLDELMAVHPALRPLVITAWRMGDRVPAEVKGLDPELVFQAGIALGFDVDEGHDDDDSQAV